MPVEVEQQAMFFFSPLVQIGIPTGCLGPATPIGEVIVRVREHTDALDVADEVQHKGEPGSRRGGETQAQPLDAGAEEKLAPGLIELVGLENLPGSRAKIGLRVVDGVRARPDFGAIVASVAHIGVDVKA